MNRSGRIPEVAAAEPWFLGRFAIATAEGGDAVLAALRSAPDEAVHVATITIAEHGEAWHGAPAGTTTILVLDPAGPPMHFAVDYDRHGLRWALASTDPVRIVPACAPCGGTGTCPDCETRCELCEGGRPDAAVAPYRVLRLVDGGSG